MSCEPRSAKRAAPHSDSLQFWAILEEIKAKEILLKCFQSVGNKGTPT